MFTNLWATHFHMDKMRLQQSAAILASSTMYSRGENSVKNFVYHFPVFLPRVSYLNGLQGSCSAFLKSFNVAVASVKLFTASILYTEESSFFCFSELAIEPHNSAQSFHLQRL